MGDIKKMTIIGSCMKMGISRIMTKVQ